MSAGYALNLVSISIDDPTAKLAIGFRRDAKRVWGAVAGRNIAIAKLVGNSQAIVMMSEPPTPKKTSMGERQEVQARHSEKALRDALYDTLSSGRSRLEWIYTERAPCGRALGHANCTQILIDMLQNYGDRGIETPVYYTWEYPTQADLARFQTLYPDLMADVDDFKSFAKDFCKESSAEIIAMDKTLGPS